MKLRIPYRVKEAAKILFAPRGKPAPRPATGLRCPACDTDNVTFAPLNPYYAEMLDKHGYIHPTYRAETINRRQYTCNACGAPDRVRLYALYCLEFLERGGKLEDILDIAPAKPFTDFLKRAGAVNHRTADLLVDGADDRLDVQNMSAYRDNQFQIFICSHVLEHVDNDIAAMRELYRVLAPGGWGICMVPINLGLTEVYENPEIKDEAGRWQHFGQYDHVRVYSKQGFVSRLESVGFRVEQYGIEHFGEDTFSRHGIHPRSVLYITFKDDGERRAVR